MILLGLAGYARTGKDTAGAYLVEHYGFARRSFADKLRAVLYATNPVVPTGRRPTSTGGAPSYAPLRTVVDRDGWEAAKALEANSPYGTRALLQRLGTDAGRLHLGPNVWVDAVMRDLEPMGRYVFTDVRFPNEADGIRAAGGLVVRLRRPGTGPINDHPSETALDSYPYDWVIEDDNVAGLHASVSALALEHGWERTWRSTTTTTRSRS